MDVPIATLAALAALQTAILLAVSVLVGLWLAPRVGFQSRVLDRVSHGAPVLRRLRPELGAALGCGLMVGALLAVGQAIAPPASATPEMTAGLLLRSLPLRLLYGGIAEELLLR